MAPILSQACTHHNLDKQTHISLLSYLEPWLHHSQDNWDCPLGKKKKDLLLAFTLSIYHVLHNATPQGLKIRLLPWQISKRWKQTQKGVIVYSFQDQTLTIIPLSPSVKRLLFPSWYQFNVTFVRIPDCTKIQHLSSQEVRELCYQPTHVEEKSFACWEVNEALFTS